MVQIGRCGAGRAGTAAAAEVELRLCLRRGCIVVSRIVVSRECSRYPVGDDPRRTTRGDFDLQNDYAGCAGRTPAPATERLPPGGAYSLPGRRCRAELRRSVAAAESMYRGAPRTHFEHVGPGRR